MPPEVDLRLDAALQGIATRHLAGPDPSVQEIERVVTDSREAGPGTLFVAVRGSHVDGHAFLSDALGRGCCAVLIEEAEAFATLEAPPEAATVVQADAGRQAVAEVAANLAGRPAERLPLVGVTGTNGKTTVSYLLEAIVRAAGRAPGVVGTVDFRFGDEVLPATHTTPGPEILQPLLARMLEAGTDLAILEVSSHALDQARVAGCLFEVALFTGLSRDHLDYHHDLETYFLAKARLFTEHLAPGARAVIWGDDSWGLRLKEMLEAAGRKVVLVTLEGSEEGPGEALAAVEDSTLDLGGISATLHLPGAGAVAVRSAMIGRHNLANLLLAATAADALGLPPEAIIEGLARCPGAPGRLQRIPDAQAAPGEAPRHAFVDYAHTDDALARVIDGLRVIAAPTARIIVVFGCGGDRDRGKRPLMAAAAARGDLVVFSSDNPRSEDPRAIITDALPGLPAGTPHRVEPDRRAAIGLAAGLCRPGDLLLVAGKGHESTQQVGTRYLPFDDAEETRRALAHVSARPQGEHGPTEER